MQIEKFTPATTTNTMQTNLDSITETTRFARPLTLCKKIIVLDGLTGTGKTMFSPLLSSFDRVQNARFECMFECLCIAASKQKLSADAAASILNLLADIKCYDGMISREVNFRPTDLSSVFNSSRSFKYLQQLFMADGASAGERIEKENPSLLLVTHQLLGCMQPAIDAYGDRLRVVEMVRHPLYLLDHWDSYIPMHGTNPRDFTLWLSHNGQLVPWFAEGWESDYIQLSRFDKAIYSVASLMRSVFECHQRGDRKSMVTFVPFEHFVLSPTPYLLAMEQFLGSSATLATQRVLKSQRVPRPSINAGPQKSIYKRYALRKYNKDITHAQDYERLFAAAKKRSSEAAFSELEKIAQTYEDTFGLWF